MFDCTNDIPIIYRDPLFDPYHYATQDAEPAPEMEGKCQKQPNPNRPRQLPGV